VRLAGVLSSCRRGSKVRSFGQWTAANCAALRCAALPTANAGHGHYATSHCKLLLFRFPSKRRYIAVLLLLHTDWRRPIAITFYFFIIFYVSTVLLVHAWIKDGWVDGWIDWLIAMDLKPLRVVTASSKNATSTANELLASFWATGASYTLLLTVGVDTQCSTTTNINRLICDLQPTYDRWTCWLQRVCRCGLLDWCYSSTLNELPLRPLARTRPSVLDTWCRSRHLLEPSTLPSKMHRTTASFAAINSGMCMPTKSTQPSIPLG